jgi:prepilin-type N-terminal cleavage/methylation domain-containing protein
MNGYTLLELLTVLTLLAVTASTIAPTARRLGDVAAVTVAREEIVAVIVEARASAMSRGASSVTVGTRPPRARISSRGVTLRAIALDRAGGVSVEVGGGRDSTTLRFDALGLGRFVSQTISLARGEASTSVVISSYGRVRRR